MSEYQFVVFRAIDAPVSGSNLEYMRRQSSRATVTSWAFKNEYHFGDFHGDALAMLRRGYDFHLHYANYGVRKLMIRLPNGFPDARSAEPYLQAEGLDFIKDKDGAGGVLQIQPYLEPGDLDDVWEFDDLVDSLLPLRAEILEGDLRPLYLAHLAVASDGNHDPKEEPDAPVPAGLKRLTKAQHALAELYGVSRAVLSAAASDSPPLQKKKNADELYTAWLQSQPDALKIAWLSRLMTDPHAAVRSEILAEYHKNCQAPGWPTQPVDRTIADIMAAAEGIQRDEDRDEAEKTARQRAEHLAKLAADPEATLLQSMELVKQRSTEAYSQVAMQLADLREALSGTMQSGLAEEYARKLRNENPNLRHLTSALRGQGFLKK